MTTKTSFSKPSKFFSFYKNALRRHLGLGLFFAGLTAVFLPVQYILTLFNMSRIDSNVLDVTRFFMGPANTYNGVAIVLFTAIELVLPVVLGINIFSYMHSKQAVDVFHALPISRKDLFLSNFAAGYTLIATSLIFNFAVIWVVSSFNFGIAQGLGVLLELLIWLAITFTIYALTVLAMVNVGTMFDGFAFTMALLGGFSGIYGIVFMLMQTYVYGFADISMPIDNMIKLSPVSTMVRRIAFSSRYLDQQGMNENLLTVALWFIAAIGVTFLAIKAYQNRKSETAQSVGIIGPVQILGRAEAVFAGGVILAALFVGVFNIEGKGAFSLAAVVGAFIAYLIMDLVLTRNVSSVFKSLHIAAIASVVSGVLVYIICNGFFVYENKVPTVDSVEEVKISYNTMYGDEKMRVSSYSGPNNWIYNPIVLKDPASVETLIAVHQTEIDFKPGAVRGTDEEDRYYGASMRIEYTLKNGKKLYRSYSGLHRQNIDNMVKLEAADEVVSQVVPLFSLPLEDVREMGLYTITTKTEPVYTFSKSEHQKLIEAIKYDLLSITSEQLKKQEKAVAYIRYDYLYVDPGMAVAESASQYAPTRELEESYSSYIMVTESFTNTIKLLREIGVYDQLAIDLSKVKQGIIIDDYYSYRGNIVGIMPYHMHSDFANQVKEDEYQKFRNTQVSDPQALVSEIKDHLSHQVVNGFTQGLDSVVVGFELENNEWAFYYVDYSKLPILYQQKLNELRSNY